VGGEKRDASFGREGDRAAHHLFGICAAAWQVLHQILT
jgi:hypothetical protein